MAPRRRDATKRTMSAIQSRYGGEVPLVEVSAKAHMGIDELLEMILLVADILDLPLGTVKTHLHRARKQMAASLKAAGWGVASRSRKRSAFSSKPGSWSNCFRRTT